MPTLPVYLDYAATTPIDDQVIKAMLACMGRDGLFGNPASSSHAYGQQARQVVELARRQVAELLNVPADDLVWTSGATESNNLAIKGCVQPGDHIITSVLEHKAVIDTVRELQATGCEVTWLTPDVSGLIQPEAVREALRDNTRLVSLMWVNNELGTLTDIAKIAGWVREHGALLHVDAAQAAGKIDIDLATCEVDLLSLSAHKVYGPKGIGALYVGARARAALCAQMHGGGHEQGLRSGTLATHQIVGMGAAFALACAQMPADNRRIATLAARLRTGLLALPGVSLNGCPDQRIAHTLNVRIDNPAFRMQAIASQIAVSSTSACNSASSTASHVLIALGLEPAQALASVRLSLGRYSQEEDVDAAIAAIEQALAAPALPW
jgi:cysteine desulfurase